MSDTLTNGLAQLQQIGAEDFRAADAHYSSADGAQIRRRVTRKRAAYSAGIGIGSVAAAGALVFGASAVGAGGLGTVTPAATGAPSPEPSPSPSISFQGDDERASETDGSNLAFPGQDAESILEMGASAINVSVDELRAAVIDALPPEAEGNYEGWLSVRGALNLYDANADDVAQFLVNSTVSSLESSGVAPENYQETLIKASLVIQESPLKSEYSKVAAVIDNRLAQNMKLELDSTVKYAHRGVAGDFDASPTQVDGLYNTYRNAGLPPGPIGAVTLEAIDAVAHPADRDWLFFVTVNPTSGEIKFADTFDEHLENVTELQTWIREHPDYVGTEFTTAEERNV